MIPRLALFFPVFGLAISLCASAQTQEVRVKPKPKSEETSEDEKEKASSSSAKPKTPAQKAAVGKGRNHPGIGIARTYLGHVGGRRWDKAATLVDPIFLKTMQSDYIRRVRRTLSIDEEIKMLKAIGVDRLRDLETMSATRFYVARQKANERATLTEAAAKRTAETSTVEIVGRIEETSELVHVLARHAQETLSEGLEQLLVVSLEKRGDRWLVAPHHQKMKVTPLADERPKAPEASKR